MRPFDPSRSLAVLIGMGQHDALPSLRGVANNLRGMSDVLTDAEMGRLPRAHLNVLDDRAGRTEIGTALIEAGLRAQDMFLVYFAGHGVVDPDTGELFLAMPETDPRLPPAYSALPYRAFAGLIRESDARIKVVILDCCYSGRATVPFMADGQQALVDQMHIEGTGILAACPPNRKALDAPDSTRFTGGLLSLLREGIPGEEPYLSLGAIHRRLRLDMISRNLPEPQFLGTANVHELALVPNRAYRRPPPPTERPVRLEITAEWGILDRNPGSDGTWQLRDCSNSGLLPKDLDMVLFEFWPGRPNAEEQAGPLIVLSQVHIDDEILTGLTIHQLSPERDDSGRPSTRVSYFRVSQGQTRTHRVSFLELWEALRDAALPEISMSINRVVRSIDPEAIESDIAAFGEAAILRTVALLSSGQAVTVLGAGHRPVNERIRFIDAVLHLLPDDARLPFSAATWCSALSDASAIRLAFSDRTRQGTARVNWDSLPSPRDTAPQTSDLTHLLPRATWGVATAAREPSGTLLPERPLRVGQTLVPSSPDSSLPPERTSTPAEAAAKTQAPDPSLPWLGYTPVPASSDSGPPPKRPSAFAERAAKAQASFEQMLEHAREEAEERHEKDPHPEDPPLTWWGTWKRRIRKILGLHDRN